MAEITIKNTKSKDESAYKTGANLSGGNGVNVNAVNPGALTGKYNDGLKNNTMNLPIRGSNFQVSIDADSEKKFENVSSIDKLFLESASAIINENSGNSGDEPTPPTPEPTHYEFELSQDPETGLPILIPSGEGIQFNIGDTVTATILAETPMIFNGVVESRNEELIIYNEITKDYVILDSNTAYVLLSEEENFMLYNSSNGVDYIIYKGEFKTFSMKFTINSDKTLTAVGGDISDHKWGKLTIENIDGMKISSPKIVLSNTVSKYTGLHDLITNDGIMFSGCVCYIFEDCYGVSGNSDIYIFWKTETSGDKWYAGYCDE